MKIVVRDRGASTLKGAAPRSRRSSRVDAAVGRTAWLPCAAAHAAVGRAVRHRSRTPPSRRPITYATRRPRARPTSGGSMGGDAQLAVRRGQAGELPGGVEPAGGGHQPHRRGAERPVLPADLGPGLPGGAPLGAESQEGDVPGRHRAASCSTEARPARSSPSPSSSARAVERATRLVIPRPAPRTCAVSAGCSRRDVQPLACSVGHSRLLGFAKCRPTAPDHSEGLMPHSRTARPGATRSGTTRPRAAWSCAGEGRDPGTCPACRTRGRSRFDPHRAAG